MKEPRPQPIQTGSAPANLTPTQRLLLDCLHQDRSRLTTDRLRDLDEALWDALFELAGSMRARPLVLERLASHRFKPLVPAACWARLEQDCRRIAVRALRQQVELIAIVRDLRAASIPVIVLKGAYLREAVYQNMALREMGDIDLMVPRRHLQPAADILTRHGYASLKAGSVDVELDATVGHHLPRSLKRGVTAAEIHWNLTTFQEPYAIDPADLWRRAIPFRVGDVTASALSPEDLLLHLCLHTSYQHEFAFGLRPMCDIAAVIRHFPELDWAAVSRRAIEWKWTSGVYASLRLARDLVGADVPSSVVDHLRRSDDDGQILSLATAQMLTSPAVLMVVNPEIARLGSPEGIGVRLLHLYQRIFLTREYLASQFSTPLDAPRWVFAWLRVRRLADLLTRYGRVVFRLLVKRQPALTAIADRKNQIRAWLVEG